MGRRTTIWLAAVSGGATAALVLLAVMVHSDVTRVAIPGIVTGIGTLVLATLNAVLLQREQSSERRREEAAASREARKVVTFAASVYDKENDSFGETLEVLNAGREPIFDVRLVEAVAGGQPGAADFTWWPGSGGSYRQVVMPGERECLNGCWYDGAAANAALYQAARGNAVISVTWTDAAGWPWRRDGRDAPQRLAEAYTWETASAGEPTE